MQPAVAGVGGRRTRIEVPHSGHFGTIAKDNARIDKHDGPQKPSFDEIDKLTVTDLCHISVHRWYAQREG
jgi:hypothetical protein